MTTLRYLLAIGLSGALAACDVGRPAPYTELEGSALVIPAAEDWEERGTVIAPGGPGEWDTRLYGMMNPGALVVKDGRYLLYYLGADGDRYDGGPANRALGVALSYDGTTFEKHGANPVLRHQPDGGHGNVVEEGVFSAAAMTDPGGDVLIWFGGMESTDSVSVDGNAVLARSPDGLTFQVVGDVLLHDDPRVYNHGDEIFPGAAFIGPNGRYHLYYVAKGDVGLWTLGLASGDRPDDLSATQEALDLESPIHGAGVPIDVPGVGLVLPVHVALDGPDRIDFLLVDPERPHDLSNRLGSVTFDDLGAGPEVDFGTVTVAMDPDRKQWLMFYVDADHGDIRLRTAPVRLRDAT